jgi:CelD/BcsL family acetyltransferase involved in cellulose biosynthesis
LWHGLRAAPLAAGDAVLAPAYHHGSEIEVLLRLGLECNYYGLTDQLEPDEEGLEALLAPHVRALQLVHYLGYPQDGPRWRRWCDERGLLLIEDAAMAWLAETPAGPVGAHGDLAVFCLYKSFGLPDGAALISRRPPRADTSADGQAHVREVAALHLSWLEQRLPLARLDGVVEEEPYVAERDFALGDPGQPPSAATLALLPRIADPGAAARRRANARFLVQALGDRVAKPFDRLPDGAAPFVLPVRTTEKEALLDRLARHGVSALDFWSAAHPSLPSERFTELAARRATTVGLPVHQELVVGDLERMLPAVLGRRPRPPELKLEPLSGLAEAEPLWQELAARGANVFATWEWASAWWQHLGRDGTLRLIACRSPTSGAVAILPLYSVRESRLRLLRFVGHGPADQLGPVCAPRDAALAARGLRQVLADPAQRWDLFVGDHLQGDLGWGTLLGARATTRESSPVVDIETNDWDQFLARRSSSLRKQIRYQERRLERDHGLRYRLSSDPDRIDDDFELLCHLHERRWAGVSEAFAGERRAFLRDFAGQALERGWLRLWFLELDGRPAAAWLGFRFGGVEAYYQGGRDPSWDHLSVGAVLVAHTLREAVADGMDEYRFLRGGEAYKGRLATRDPGVETVVLAGSAAGHAAVGAAGLRRTAGRLKHALPKR